MSDLIFVTGNSLKFAIAASVLQRTGIPLLQKRLDIDEIQSEDSEYIARKKAEAAYAILRKPLVVSDDSWSFLGLNGFPGPYNKSINHWFSVEDWLHLTASLTDRRVEMTQIIVYHDKKGQHIFSKVIPGQILPEARGANDQPSQSIVTLEGDNGLSTAEAIARDAAHYNTRPAAKVWEEFAEWYKKEKA